MIKSLHRLDLLKEFPKYDYGNPKEPWRTDYRRGDNNTAAQIQAFHYYWSNKICDDTGHIGISLLMPSIPCCLCVAPRPGTGAHIVSPIENLVNLIRPESISLIIVSSALSILPCHSLPKDTSPEPRKRRSCSGEEILPVLQEWASLLMPGGVMIANLIDAAIAREAGWSLFDKDPQIQHSWSPRRFEENIVKPMLISFELEEFNNMGNHFSFNCVLRKK